MGVYVDPFASSARVSKITTRAQVEPSLIPQPQRSISDLLWAALSGRHSTGAAFGRNRPKIGRNRTKLRCVEGNLNVFATSVHWSMEVGASRVRLTPPFSHRCGALVRADASRPRRKEYPKPPASPKAEYLRRMRSQNRFLDEASVVVSASVSWKSLSEEERAPYVEAYRRKKARYESWQKWNEMSEEPGASGGQIRRTRSIRPNLGTVGRIVGSARLRLARFIHARARLGQLWGSISPILGSIRTQLGQAWPNFDTSAEHFRSSLVEIGRASVDIREHAHCIAAHV